MDKYYKKSSFIFVVSIFLLVICHIALLMEGNSIFKSLFVYIGRTFWIIADFLLCLAGFYCSGLFMHKQSGLKEWFSVLVHSLKWILPMYYLILLFYLTVGIMLQKYLGNTFKLNDGYIPAFLFFYSNFLLSQGPWSGVALEGTFLLSMVFQLFFGIGIVLSIIKKKYVLPFIIVSLWIMAIILRMLWINKNPWFIYYNTLTRPDAFLAGLLLSYLYSYSSMMDKLIKKKNLFLMCGSFILFIAALFTRGLSRYCHSHLIDIISYPAIAVFSFVLLNWIFITELPSVIDKFYRWNKIVFPVYVMKLPIVYIIKGSFKKMNVFPSVINNILFITCSIAACYLFGVIWYFLVERNIGFFMDEKVKKL